MSSDKAKQFVEKSFAELESTFSDIKRVGEDLVDKNKRLLDEKVKDRRENDALNGKLLELQKKAEHDQLTGLLNRHGFESFVKEVQPVYSGGSIALLDIDKFKHINDTHGHEGGDRVLREVADYIKDLCRKGDAICRWGGEEIAIFFPGSKPEDVYKIFKRKDAEKAVINVDVKFRDGEDQSDILVTFSGGITELGKEEDLESAISRADKTLYFVKQHGRNELMISGTEEYMTES